MPNTKTDKLLSKKHKRFVRLVRAGRSATSAYAAAYNVPNSLSTRAASCRLMKDARIIAAINKGRNAAAPVHTVLGKKDVNAQECPPPAVETTKPNAAQLEANIREKLRQISEPPPIQRFTLPPPKYQRPPAPPVPSEQEALRRRLRSQGINGFGFMDNTNGFGFTDNE